MEDHHVDRPDVEAQQCVKLTGTNRSIGLILSRHQKSGTRNQSDLMPDTRYLIPETEPRRVQRQDPMKTNPPKRQNQTLHDPMPDNRSTITPDSWNLIPDTRIPSFDGLVAMARGPTPDPIPNSAVKTLSADGTAS